MLDSPDVLPQNLQAERTLLGALLLVPEGLGDVMDIIVPRDFYREGHRKVYQSIVAMRDMGEQVDLVTVKNDLQKRGFLDAVGGVAYLGDLVDGIPKTSNVRHYAKIIRDKSSRRSLIHVAQSLVSDALDETDGLEETLGRFENSVSEIADRSIKHGLVHVKEAAIRVVERLDAIEESEEGNIAGLSTGFDRIDVLLSGFQSSDLIILAARPSMGKTALSLDIVRHVCKGGKVSAIFSIEMSEDALMMRLLSAEGHVPGKLLRNGDLSSQDMDNAIGAIGRLAAMNLWLDDSAVQTVATIGAAARRLQRDQGLDLLVVDYLQLVGGTRERGENREQQVAGVGRGLKSLAKTLEIPVLALCQLSRATESRKSHRPQLADLRESGGLEQDADVVMLLFREEFYDKTQENHGIAEVIVAKHRNGPVGRMELVFIEEFTRFDNLAWFGDS